MTVYAITDTKKGRTGIAPTYLQTTRLSWLSVSFLIGRKIFEYLFISSFCHANSLV